MSNRFHNKYHRHNHHTTATAGDIDSAHDPIASEADPFQGDFYQNGNLRSTGVYATSGVVFGDFTVGGVFTSTSSVTMVAADIATLQVDYLSSMDEASITLLSPITLNNQELIGLMIDMCEDVTTTGATSSEVLVYDGSIWTNGKLEIDSFGVDVWGDGLVISGDQIVLDYATSDDVLAGTSTTAVITPATLPTGIDEWKVSTLSAGSESTTSKVWVQYV